MTLAANMTLKPTNSPRPAGLAGAVRGSKPRTGARRIALGPPDSASALPADLAEALAAHPAARAVFTALAPSHRREYLQWIEAARRADTRRRRIAAALERMVARPATASVRR